MIRLILRRACALVFLLALPHAAHAHAVLLGSTPKAGEQLMDSPKELTLNFNENVGPIFFKVLDKSGKEVGAPGEIRLDGNNLHMTLGETLPNGTYVLTYRVVSADTHPVGATFLFAVGEAVAAASDMKAEGSGGASGWTVAVALNRLALYLGMTLAAGAALFALAMTVPSDAQAANARLGFAAAAVAFAAYVLAIGLGGAEMVMGGPSVLLSAQPWRQGGGTTLLPSAAIGLPAMVLLMIAFRRPAPPAALLAIGAALAIGSFLVTGHAATAAPVWLMATMVAVHLACAAFWLGALRPLYVTARSASIAEAGLAMTRFSGRAIVTVAALFASGVVLTWVQVEGIKGMIGTDYGQRLTVKIALFFALLALAAFNKLVLTPAMERAEARAAAGLRRTIFVEYVLYVLILAAAVSLTLTSPPRALNAGGAAAAAMASEGFKTTVQAEGYRADVEVTPAKTGENMFMITVRDKSGAALKLESMDMTLALPAAGIAEVEKKGQAAGPEMWHFMVGETIIPGEWEVKARAFVNAFDKVDFEFKVPIK
jgi:copper transport protein